MIDIKSASFSAGRLMQIGTQLHVTNNTQTISIKAKDDTQNTGTYDLIFPYMHVDYPTRTEVETFIKTSFTEHNLSTYNGLTPSSPTIMSQTEICTSDGIYVRGGSPVNSIGYGI